MNKGIGYLCEAAMLPPLENEGMNTTFVNLLYYFCATYQSRHLEPAVRAQLQVLVQEAAMCLGDIVTGDGVLSKDMRMFVEPFVEFAFLDDYLPGLVAELARINELPVPEE